MKKTTKKENLTGLKKRQLLIAGVRTLISRDLKQSLKEIVYICTYLTIFTGFVSLIVFVLAGQGFWELAQIYPSQASLIKVIPFTSLFLAVMSLIATNDNRMLLNFLGAIRFILFAKWILKVCRFLEKNRFDSYLDQRNLRATEEQLKSMFKKRKSIHTLETSRLLEGWKLINL